jgi:ribosomal-protein-alanine N-acetyltransferase
MYARHVPELQRLRSDHADAVLAFELENRAFFALSITDRGDAFFEDFPARHHELLAEQEAGACFAHVLVDDDGTVLGRFNLFTMEEGTAAVGYRVAERVGGQGVATSTLRELCRLAAHEYGLRKLIADTNYENLASQRVLAKAGFVPVGTAEVGGRPGIRYELDVSADYSH